MAKVRVYELAKELGVESKTLLNHLKEQGEFVRSASSTIEPPVVRKIRETFPAELAAEGGPATDVKGSPARPAAKKSAVKAGAAAPAASLAAPVAAPAAPVAAPAAPFAPSGVASVAASVGVPRAPSRPVAGAPKAPAPKAPAAREGGSDSGRPGPRPGAPRPGNNPFAPSQGMPRGGGRERIHRRPRAVRGHSFQLHPGAGSSAGP